MKRQIKNLLSKLTQIELMIEDEEYNLDIEEILELEDSSDEAILDIHNKYAFLSALAAISKYKLGEAKSELAAYEAEKDEEIRSSGGKKTETSVLAQIRLTPEWLDKRRERNLCEKEYELIVGLKETLQLKIEAQLVLILKHISSLISEKQLSGEALAGMAVDHLAKKKADKKKKKKKPKKKKKTKSVGGQRRHADSGDSLNDEDEEDDDEEDD